MSVLRKFAAAGLTAAAVSLSACFDDSTSSNTEDTSNMGGDANKVISSRIDSTITAKNFESSCDSAGGIVEIHASCGGTNSCKGLSYNKWSHKLTEHSCKAANTCGGFTCVSLPKDAGKSGAELYKASCADCHGDASKGFNVMVPEGTDSTAALEIIKSYDDRTLRDIIAFGVSGSSNGYHYSSMPAYREKMSVKEIDRLSAYLRTLQPNTSTFTPYP